MTRRERFANDAESTLNGQITAVATSLIVNDASNFPSEGDFRLVIDNEIILVTAVSGNTFTIVRQQEGTSGAIHNDEATVAQILTEDGLNTYVKESDDPFHGLRPPYRIMDTNGDLLTHSSFTTINVGSSTISTDANGNIVIQKPNDAGVFDVVALVRTAPSTPYTITGAVSVQHTNVNAFGPASGLAFREASSGKLLTFYNRGGLIATANVGVWYLTNATTFGGDAITAKGWPHGVGQPVVWYQIEDDGTNLDFRLSTDGVSFIEIGSVLRGTYFTGAGPDQIGYWITAQNAGFINYAKLCAWDGE